MNVQFMRLDELGKVKADAEEVFLDYILTGEVRVKINEKVLIYYNGLLLYSIRYDTIVNAFHLRVYDKSVAPFVISKKNYYYYLYEELIKRLKNLRDNIEEDI